VSSSKTAEPIEMPFGLRTGVGPRNHVLDAVMNMRQFRRGRTRRSGNCRGKSQNETANLTARRDSRID